MDPHDPFMDWEQPGIGYARARMEHPDADTYLEPMKKAYKLEIEYMDEHLGRLFEGLRELGVYDDSVIIFTADHGEEFYDHEGWWHGQTLYDELIHVPLMMKLPKNTGAGTILADFARHIDLAPSILALAGLRAAETMKGSALVTLDGRPAAYGPQYVYAENDFEGNVLEAVRTRDRKLIHANVDNRRGLKPVEFYDLATDPAEQNNLADQPEMAVEQAALAKTLDDMEAFIREDAAEPLLLEGSLEEQRERLENLGYMAD
jgi:arylsulfatase A-like enzyme